MTWLAQLLAATEAPPETDDIDHLLAVWSRVVSARDVLLADAPKGIDADDALVAELHARQEAWRTALAKAKQACGRSRLGTAQIRRYQRSGRAAEP